MMHVEESGLPLRQPFHEHSVVWPSEMRSMKERGAISEFQLDGSRRSFPLAASSLYSSSLFG